MTAQNVPTVRDDLIVGTVAVLAGQMDAAPDVLAETALTLVDALLDGYRVTPLTESALIDFEAEGEVSPTLPKRRPPRDTGLGLGLRNPAEWQPGVVGVTDWLAVPWTERQVKGVAGLVVVVHSDAALGFEMRGGNHANWLALVKGERSVFAVPGCQIKYIAYDVGTGNSDVVEVP